MTKDELKQHILQMIERVYCKKYIGKIFIHKLQPVGYTVSLGMNNNDKPIVISAELDDQPFLKFFEEELRHRGLNLVKYFLGVKSYPNNCSNNINKSCKCNETAQ